MTQQTGDFPPCIPCSMTLMASFSLRWLWLLCSLPRLPCQEVRALGCRPESLCCASHTSALGAHLLSDFYPWLPGAAVTKYQSLGDINSRNVSSHSSGGWKSMVKVPAGLVPPEGCEGRICSRPLALAGRWPSSSCVSSSGVLVYAFVHKFPLSIGTFILDYSPLQ